MKHLVFWSLVVSAVVKCTGAHALDVKVEQIPKAKAAQCVRQVIDQDFGDVCGEGDSDQALDCVRDEILKCIKEGPKH